MPTSKQLSLCTVYTICLFLSCTHPNNPPPLSSAPCIYKELSNTVSIKKKKEEIEKEVEGNLSAALKTNIRLLSSLEIGGDIKAGIHIGPNVIEDVQIDERKYSPQIIDTHNSIIQILCDIKQDIESCTNNPERKKELEKSMDKKRDEYFAFILNNFYKQKDKSSVDTNKSNSIKNPNREIPAQPVCTIVDIDVHISSVWFRVEGKTSEDVLIDGLSISKSPVVIDFQRFKGQSRAENDLFIIKICKGRYNLSLRGVESCRESISANEPIKNIYLNCEPIK